MNIRSSWSGLLAYSCSPSEQEQHKYHICVPLLYLMNKCFLLTDFLA